MKILVTGFGLWGDATTNPSWEMIKDLPKTVGQHEIVLGKVSVVYNKIENEIKSLIDTNKPDMIISFGLSGSLFKPRVETYGWNLAGSGADADGNNYNGRLNTALNARVGYKTTYNGQTVMDWVKGTTQTIETSNDPGKFLCNALVYYTGQYLTSKGLNTPYMFTHVPKETTYGLDKLKDLAKILIKKAVEINDQPFNWEVNNEADNISDKDKTQGDRSVDLSDIFKEVKVDFSNEDSLIKVDIRPMERVESDLVIKTNQPNSRYFIQNVISDIDEKKLTGYDNVNGKIIGYLDNNLNQVKSLMTDSDGTLRLNYKMKKADPVSLDLILGGSSQDSQNLLEAYNSLVAYALSDKPKENLLTGVSNRDYTPTGTSTRYSLIKDVPMGIYAFDGQIENTSDADVKLSISIGNFNTLTSSATLPRFEIDLKPGLNHVQSININEIDDFTDKLYLEVGYKDQGKITIKSNTIKFYRLDV